MAARAARCPAGRSRKRLPSTRCSASVSGSASASAVLDRRDAQVRRQRRRPAGDRDHADQERRAVGEHAVAVAMPREPARAWLRRGRLHGHRGARRGERRLGRHACPRLEHDGGLEHVLRLATQARLDQQARVGGSSAGASCARPGAGDAAALPVSAPSSSR